MAKTYALLAVLFTCALAVSGCAGDNGDTQSPPKTTATSSTAAPTPSAASTTTTPSAAPPPAPSSEPAVAPAPDV